MKITNSNTHKNFLETYPSKKNVEKTKENQIEMKEIRKTADNLTLSDRAKKLLKDAELVKEIAEQVEAAANSKGGPYDELTKCLEIASRIMKGDKVPQADMRFLAEKQPELYSSAILMRQNTQNPKRHKSLLENEKDSNVVEDTGNAEIKEALANRKQSKEE